MYISPEFVSGEQLIFPGACLISLTHTQTRLEIDLTLLRSIRVYCCFQKRAEIAIICGRLSHALSRSFSLSHALSRSFSLSYALPCSLTLTSAHTSGFRQRTWMIDGADGVLLFHSAQGKKVKNLHIWPGKGRKIAGYSLRREKEGQCLCECVYKSSVS